MEMSEPNFYYLIRHPNGDMVGVHRTKSNYGQTAALGAYPIELTTKEVVETLDAFGSLPVLIDDSDPLPEPVTASLLDGIVSEP